MEHEERALLYEMDRVDLEYAVTKSLAKGLRDKGAHVVADRVDEAVGYLQKAAFMLHDAHKWLGVPVGEQLTMDFMNE